jgi:uncharacterized membrane protein (DUF2068 family)
MSELTQQHANQVGPARERDRILTMIAVFKFVKAATLIAVGVGALRLIGSDLRDQANTMFDALGHSIDVFPVLKLLRDIGALAPNSLKLAGAGAFLYAALFVTEGVGLWRQRRWAEYLTVVATASFIPFEVYELVLQRTWPRIGALVVNILVVLYLLYRLKNPLMSQLVAPSPATPDGANA